MSFGNKQGYGISSKHIFAIPNGANGSAVNAVDLGRVYAWVVIRISSATGLQANTTAILNLGMSDSDTLVPLSDDKLPFDADGTIHLIVFAFARRVQVVLNTVTSGDAQIEIYGMDAAENSANA